MIPETNIKQIKKGGFNSKELLIIFFKNISSLFHEQSFTRKKNNYNSSQYN